MVFAAAICAPGLWAQTVWEKETINSTDTLYDVAFGGGVYVAVSEVGTIGTSADAEVWNVSQSPVSTALQGADAGNGEFLAVGEAGVILRSADGSTWGASENSTTSDFLSDAAYGAGKWVVVGGDTSGGGGTVLTSSAPGTWVERDAVGAVFLSRVVFGGGRFVAIGSGGKIIYSTDGETWAAAVSGTTRYLTGLAYDDGTFVAVGQRGTIIVSTDGVGWTSKTSGRGEWLHGIAWGNGTWVAVGEAGAMLVSTDLDSWSPGVSGTAVEMFALVSGGGNMVAVGDPDGSSSLVLRSSTPVAIPVPEAIDDTQTAWLLSGDGDWFGQAVVTSDGVDAARSAALSAGQESAIKATLTGPTTVSFTWKISAGASDSLSFLIDDVPAQSISGDADWGSVSLPIDAGEHDICWVFARGVDPPQLEDAAWLDVVIVGFFTYDDWVEFHFTLEQRADPAVSGANADPDADGVSNYFEWAQGGDPWLPKPIEFFTISLGAGGTGTDISYRMLVERPTNFVVRYSGNLLDWQDLMVAPTLVSSDGVSEIWQFHDPTDTGSAGRRFYQVVLSDL